MTTYRIPFNIPYLSKTEVGYTAEVLAGSRIEGDGSFTQRCRDLLRDELGTHGCMLTTSCTHALEMAALTLDIQPGDEVIVPTFTFVTTASAFALRGARPVFADIRADTLNLDEAKLESLITARTKAIVVIHYAGVGSEMDAILEIANRRAVAVIEDNAHSLFGKYKGKYLGTFGSLATQSFDHQKNFTCGQGGALLINDPQYLEQAEIVRDRGTNRQRFFRGQVDKYTWVGLGSNYQLSEVLAAILWAQLEQRQHIQRQRRHVWERYYEHLEDWARANGVALPTVPAGCEHAYHLFHLILPSLELRQSLISHLRRRSINSVFHYVPLHLSEMGQKLGGQPGGCPVAENLSDRLLRLPFYTGLTVEDQEYVIEAIREFQG